MQHRPRRRKSPWRVRKDEKHLALTGEGRLLDFGCGGGEFLERMHWQGWRVTGLDACSDAVERIRSELRLPALLGSLPHRSLEPNSFDVITMWQSLEHVHDPREVLRQAYFLLAPSGKLVVAVPNIDSLPFRWFGRSWVGLDLPRHLTHFTPQTLRWMLERVGFRVIRMRGIRHSAWLRMSARIAAAKPDGASWQRLLTTRPFSRMVSAYAHLTGQADCIIATAARSD
jgi:SAM-dependent methyltransferase